MKILSHSYFASVLVCVFGLGFGMPALAAATYTWSGGAGDNDWTNKDNYEEGVAPVAGDTVKVGGSHVASLSDDDAASWSLVSSLAAVKTISTTARIEVTVNGSETQTLNCQISGYAYQEKYHGTFAKLGSGTLKFGNPDASAYNYLNISVVAGTLYLQQNATGNCWFKNAHVAAGAKLYGIKGYRSFLNELTGDGDYTTVDRAALLTTGGTEDSPVVCNVRCTNCGLYQGGKYVFTNPSNSFTSVYVYNHGITAVPTFSKDAESSPLGSAGTLCFAESGCGTYRFMGAAAETCDRAFKAYYSKQAPVGIDAGPYGGLTLTGTWSMGDWGNNGMGQILLTGSNTTESVFDGTVNGDAGLCYAFLKRGSGTWRLGATGTRTSMFSSTAVEEGRLRYDSILEKGDPSALGTATDTLAPYCGAYDESKRVDYAVLLGRPDISWPSDRLAIFDYSGAAKRGVTTRPIALQGDAAVMSSSAKLVWRGAWSNAGTNNLVLAGDATTFTNVFADVTDGVAEGTRTGVIKDGSGTWMLTGTNSFTGPLIVNGGTLIARRPTSEYRWYRLVIRDGYLGPGYDYIKIGRVAFMNDKGVRQSCGLTYVSNDMAGDSRPAYYYEPFNAVLEPGEFSWGAPLRVATWQGRTMADICKSGECWDGSCLNFTRGSVASSYLNEPKHWLYFDFRLPESVDAICYYDMAPVYGTNSGSTAGYMFKAWTMMGSTDGIHWDALHSVEDARSSDPDQKMKQRSGGNTWMASNLTTSNSKDANIAFDTEKLQPIASADPNAASVPFLTTVEYVTVANGAVLEAEGDITLSKFKAAYGATAGTVKGFALADDCEIEVTGIPKGVASFVVPLTFEGAAPEDAEWTVKDGEKVSRRFEAVARDGKLTLIRRGSLIILR